MFLYLLLQAYRFCQFHYNYVALFDSFLKLGESLPLIMSQITLLYTLTVTVLISVFRENLAEVLTAGVYFCLISSIYWLGKSDPMALLPVSDILSVTAD